MSDELHVVTGAFGYSGKYITRRLLEQGIRVRTITNSPDRANPFEGKVEAHAFNFNDPPALVSSLRNASVLYNTYWIRFNHADFTHSEAINNTLTLFKAAQQAGVSRIVHVSITNPSEDSHLEYFKGKAILERALIESGISYAILRPTVLFGKEDILVNNIAWALRRFPIFGLFGDGNYRLQPIFVDDLAKLAVEKGHEQENVIIDAIGPETFTYRELVRHIGRIIGKPRPLVPMPPWLGYRIGTAISRFVGDTMITREEIQGLMQGLLYTHSQPAGDTKLTEWVSHHSVSLGIRYASELARRRNRKHAYDSL